MRTVSIEPDQFVWIFGTARTGSTWLSSLLGHAKANAEWKEPQVGNLFGTHYYDRVERIYNTRGQKHRDEFWILGGRREVWLGSIRSFVLDGAGARFPELRHGGYLIVKEPHGSIGAPLLMEALPESRFVYLIRDPRDVVSSHLDARTKGSWLYERARGERDDATVGNVSPDAIVEQTAQKYVTDMGRVEEAFEAHQGRKVRVQYEELRADTPMMLRGIRRALDMQLTDKDIDGAVKKLAFESLPVEGRGPGKFRRKAAPGGWREDLTPRQVEIVERITAPILDRYYQPVVKPGSGLADL